MNDRTMRLQVFICQMPKSVYTIVLRVVTYRCKSIWIELPRVVQCTPCATVYDYPNCINKLAKIDIELNPTPRCLI